MDTPIDYFIENSTFYITALKYEKLNSLEEYVLPCTSATHIVFSYSADKSYTHGDAYNSNSYSKHNIIVLPPNIKILTLDKYYNKQIKFSRYMIHIIFGYYFDTCVFLPKMLSSIVFGYRFDKYIVLTKNIVNCSFHYFFDQQIKLTKKLKYFELGHCYHFTHTVVLNKNLLHISFSKRYNSRIILNKYLVHLNIGSSSNLPLLTPYLTHISLNTRSKQKLIFDKTRIQSMYVNSENHFVFDNLPNNLLLLEINESVCAPRHNLPSNTKCYTNYFHDLMFDNKN